MLLKDQSCHDDSFINDENSQLNQQQSSCKRQLKAFKSSTERDSREVLVQINSMPEDAF